MRNWDYSSDYLILRNNFPYNGILLILNITWLNQIINLDFSTVCFKHFYNKVWKNTFSQAVSPCGDWTIDVSPHCHTRRGTCCFSSCILVTNWPPRRGGWYISKESCGDEEMWVSVLVLGAAEHPIPQLSGPPHPCLSTAASSLIKWSRWRSLWQYEGRL